MTRRQEFLQQMNFFLAYIFALLQSNTVHITMFIIGDPRAENACANHLPPFNIIPVVVELEKFTQRRATSV